MNNLLNIGPPILGSAANSSITFPATYDPLGQSFFTTSPSDELTQAGMAVNDNSSSFTAAYPGLTRPFKGASFLERMAFRGAFPACVVTLLLGEDVMDIKTRFSVCRHGCRNRQAMAQARPRWAWSGKQPADVDPNYKPRRLSKYSNSGKMASRCAMSPGVPAAMATAEMGKKMAQTWADCICIDLEHAVSISPMCANSCAACGWRPHAQRPQVPTTFVHLPIIGYSKEYMEANGWILAQIAACGVMGVDVCHARSGPSRQRYRRRYPFPYRFGAKNAGRVAV